MKKRGNAEGYTVSFLFCQVRKTLDFFFKFTFSYCHKENKVLIF